MQNTNRKSPESAQHINRGKNGKLKEGLAGTAADTRDERADGADIDKPHRGFVDATSQVVFQAASILEEEIAAGIVAAKEVENRLVKSRVVSSRTRNNVFQRFRKDLHEVVDVILDVIDVAVDHPDIPRKSAVNVRGVPKQRQEQPPTSNGHVPLLNMPQSVRAGETVAMAMTVENDVDESTAEFGFLSTHLVNTSGDRIAARQVKFSPRLVSVGPNQAEAVTVSVTVPQDKPSGTYVGVIQTTRVGRPQAVLIVQVG